MATPVTRVDAMRRPLCVSHFLEIANTILFDQAKPQDAQDGDGASCSRPRKRRKIEAPAATRRIQPPRAAKTKAPRYTEDERTATPAVCKSREEFEAELWRQLARREPLAGCARGCIFGPPPWTCGMCEETLVREGVLARTQDPEAGEGRAPYAKMVAGPEDWAKVRVSPESCIKVGDVSVVVDTCDEPMIFML